MQPKEPNPDLEYDLTVEQRAQELQERAYDNQQAEEAYQEFIASKDKDQVNTSLPF